MSEPGPALAWLVAAETILYAAFSAVAAALAACVWLRGRRSAWAQAARGQAVVVVRGACGAALLGVVVQLVWQTAAMRGASAGEPFWRSLLALAASTHAGRSACVAAVALVVVSVAAMSRGFAAGRPAATGTAVSALAVFAAARSVVSHAAAAGDFGVAVGVLWLHLVLVGGWLGSVAIGAFTAFSAAPRSREDSADAFAWLAALSRVAGWLLLGILLTGGFNLWRVWAAAPSAAWWGAPYANALGVKLVWVGLAAGLGAYNRLVRLPAVRGDRVASGPMATVAGPGGAALGDGRWHAVVCILRVEAVVLLLALVASAVLGNTEPPGD